MPVGSGLLSRSLYLVTGYSPSRTQTGTLGSGGVCFSWLTTVGSSLNVSWNSGAVPTSRERNRHPRAAAPVFGISLRTEQMPTKPHRTRRGLHATARPLATEDTLQKFWGLWTYGEQPPVMTSSSCQLTQAGSAPSSLQRSWALPSNALVCFLSNWAQRMECG